MTILIPAILSTKQCHDYVGGSRIWDELIEKHSDILQPVRTLPRGDSFYRRETVDKAILAAELSGSLLQHRPDPSELPIKKRNGRRFTEQG